MENSVGCVFICVCMNVREDMHAFDYTGGFRDSEPVCIISPGRRLRGVIAYL